LYCDRLCRVPSHKILLHNQETVAYYYCYYIYARLDIYKYFQKQGMPQRYPRIKLPSVEHKYQTIQSFRPEEVKEFFSQHFLEMESASASPSPPRTSLPSEEGVRRFSLVQRTFKTRKALRNSKDAAMFREELQLDPKGQLAEMRKSHESHRSETPDDNLELLSLREEVQRLNAQLTHEREAHTRELARLRAQVRSFESKLAQSYTQMDRLLLTMEAREKSVQELLAKNLPENEKDEVDNGEGQEETKPLSLSAPAALSSVSLAAIPSATITATIIPQTLTKTQTLHAISKPNLLSS